MVICKQCRFWIYEGNWGDFPDNDLYCSLHPNNYTVDFVTGDPQYINEQGERVYRMCALCSGINKDGNCKSFQPRKSLIKTIMGFMGGKYLRTYLIINIV